MLLSYYLPGVVSLIRVTVTLWFLVVNPFDLPLRVIQLVVLIAYLIFNFTYFKLYSDGIPVISIILPSLLHICIIFMFKRILVVKQFIILVAIDILYLITKSLKASMFPFVMDEDTEDSDFDLSDFTENAE